MTQQIHFITYGNHLYNNSKQRIHQEALNTGWFNSINICGPESLTESFTVEFKDILEKPRGGGYWIWKYDIIKQHLSKLPDNDILIYLDAGCHFNYKGKKRFDEYIEMLNNSNETIISFQMSYIEKHWTTKQIFDHFNIDTNHLHANSGQYLNGILLMKNTTKMKNIIDECINTLRADHLLVTDHYNTFSQIPEFKDNRHDQSISSLIRKKMGSIVIPRDETDFTNYDNPESLEYPFCARRLR